MLTGVCTVSSAKTNEGWLSEEACLDGTSAGIPCMLDLLIGLEKLNAGRGSVVPPTDISELIEGDRAMNWCVTVGDEIGDVEKPLPPENDRSSAGL